jgi:hypothetical protein
MTKIIGFSGKKLAGKSTCAQFLRRNQTELFGDAVVYVYSFAGPLRQIISDLFNIPFDDLMNKKDELSPILWGDLPRELDRGEGFLTNRELMQVFGTDIIRSICADAWVNATMSRIRMDNPDLAIIDDVRYPNELVAIQDRGGVVIKLLRGDVTDTHISENALNDLTDSAYNLVLDNRILSIGESNQWVVRLLNNKGWLKQSASETSATQTSLSTTACS